jgi:RimJ/RimL family protein N-acetyltransferase
MFARTKRLTLRPGWPEEAEALRDAIAHEAVVMRLARAPWPYALEHAADFLSRDRGAEEATFLIFAHDDPAPCLVGGIGLEHAGAGKATLGYWLTPSAWGRGYAGEAAAMMLEIARHAFGIARVEATHHLDNPASRRVLEKLGFVEVRRESQMSLAQGRDVESAICEIAFDAGAALGQR